MSPLYTQVCILNPISYDTQIRNIAHTQVVICINLVNKLLCLNVLRFNSRKSFHVEGEIFSELDVNFKLVYLGITLSYSIASTFLNHVTVLTSVI